jgi:cystathionine beta-synthase
MEINNSLLSLIGNTPMLKLSSVDTGVCELYVKLESQNPGGSIKDRIGLSIIEQAEESGDLKEGGTIIEATAGNTGIGLALVAALKGYKIILIIPDKMSREKILHLEGLGAEIILTRSDVPEGHPEYYHDVARRVAEETPGSFLANQFSNPANPFAHRTTTAPEIWDQMEGDLDAVVAGVGSGGTLTGLAEFFKEKDSSIQIVAADPENSIVADAVIKGSYSYEGGSWLVEGVGEDFIPDNLDLSLIDDAETVTDKEAFEVLQVLLQEEGILGGSSTGTLVAGAIKWCQKQTEPKKVVTFICDTGNKYLSKAFNKSWLHVNNLLNKVKE